MAEEVKVEEGQKVEVKKGWWNTKSKGAKAGFIISIVLIVLCIGFLVTLLFARQIYGNEIGDMILGEGVPNGFVKIGNAFAAGGMKILSSLIVAAVTLVLTIILTTLIKMFTAKGKRAKTTGSIINSLLKYAAVIIGLAIILAIWGVNIAGIVGSLGIVTLIVGLGCQTLINDIVSGLFIVFDDYFNVGDMVIIDGFRGYITEIGLKSVKLDDRCGNVKSITNSSITTCVNLSRGNNLISVTMEASYFEDVRKVEAIAINNLPKVKEKIPAIIEGPFYKGIDSFTSSGVGYKFVCTTKAENRFQVQRDMNREIYLMFVDNDIVVPFNQITVNQADNKDLTPATKDQKDLVEQFIVAQREINSKQKKNKKTKLIDKVKDTIKDSVDQFEKDYK